ncbi:MAG TPA: tetratricopeptide repeat protein, partial [Rhizomicrobium sp.]
MTRSAATTAVSAFCLLWTAGCANAGIFDFGSSPAPAKPAETATQAQPNAMPDPQADIATLAKTLPGTVDGEIRRAQLLRAKGDYDEASRSLAQLILVEPDNGRVVGEYGKVLEQQGHSTEALPFLKRSAQLTPNDWSVQSALGIAYDQVDDHASARGAYERALALRPGEASVLNNYAVSRMLAGDYAGAKRLFAQAQANGASNPKIAGNLEKLATLAPSPTPTPAPQANTAQSTVQQPAPPHAPSLVSPVVVAKTNPVIAPAPQAPHNSTVVPAKPNPVVVVASQTPHASSVAPTVKGGAASVRVAVVAPKALGGQVVMERVP